MLRARVVTVGGLLTLLATACGGGSGGNTTAPETQPTPSVSTTESSSQSTIAGLAANDHGQKDVTGQKSVALEVDDFYFEPSVLKGAPGQQVTLDITNDSGTEHNLTVAAQKVDKDIDGHGKVTATVTFPKSGVLSFYCEYHKSSGMAGGLLVSGNPAGSPTSSSPGGGGGYYGGGYYGGGG